jgi:hypothetical protein
MATANYIDRLADWYPTAAKWLHGVPGESDLAYYGTGGHEHWAIQANCTAFSALAVLATAPEVDETPLDRDALRGQALGMLRYLLGTHLSGRRVCVSGRAWGHSWISSLGLERAAHGIAALRPWLTEEDHAAMRAVLRSESDFLLEGYPVVGAIDAATGRNKPESNLWNGALLYRTALLYPEAPHAAVYREKATALLLNGLSIPADADADTPYAGRALRDWHVGPNFTENFGLHHHGYLNLGYMVISLSQIAMLHYFCRDYGLPAPPELYPHAAELWRLVKSLTFDDGRLWRIGGDTRVRYCYCQDYAVPLWVLARDLWGDADADRFAAGWLELVATEQTRNPDGAFLGERLASLAQVSPLYYCRLEGDRAGSLSMGAYWTRRFPADAAHPVPAGLATLPAWEDDFHGAAMVRGQRLASWTWQAAQRPTGTIVPADRSDLVEWGWNLAGRIRGAGCAVEADIEHSRIDAFPGGFVSRGSYRWVSSQNPAEGTDPEGTARTQLVFAVLPDDATVVVLQRAQTLKPVYLNEVAGLYLNIPNDLYNGGTRTYRMAGATRTLAGAGGAQEPVAETLDCGDRLEIEGRIAVQALYGGSLTLRRPGQRLVNLHHNVPLAFSGAGASLYCDLLCLPYVDAQAFYEKDVQLFDIGAVITIDGASPATLLSPAGAPEKILAVTGMDGRRYLLAANFGASETTIRLPDAARGAEGLSGARPLVSGTGVAVVLGAGEAVLLRVATEVAV